MLAIHKVCSVTKWIWVNWFLILFSSHFQRKLLSILVGYLGDLRIHDNYSYRLGAKKKASHNLQNIVRGKRAKSIKKFAFSNEGFYVSSSHYAQKYEARMYVTCEFRPRKISEHSSPNDKFEFIRIEMNGIVHRNETFMPLKTPF